MQRYRSSFTPARHLLVIHAALSRSCLPGGILAQHLVLVGQRWLCVWCHAGSEVFPGCVDTRFCVDELADFQQDAFLAVEHIQTRWYQIPAVGFEIAASSKPVCHWLRLIARGWRLCLWRQRTSPLQVGSFLCRRVRTGKPPDRQQIQAGLGGLALRTQQSDVLAVTSACALPRLARHAGHR